VAWEREPWKQPSLGC